MTIDAFCQAWSVPRTRTARTARELALQALAEKEGGAPDQLKDADLSKRRLGPTTEKGVRIEKPRGHERFSYEVVDPETLFQYLAQKHGSDLLTDRDIDRLLDHAQFLRDVIDGEAGWGLEMRIGYTTERRDKDEILSDLQELLLKTGRAK